MKYRYLITETVRDSLNSSNLSSKIIRELKSQEESTQPLHADALYSTHIMLERRVRPGGERVIWFEERREGLCLYVLRAVYMHSKYSKELTSIEKARQWEADHPYDDLEKMEVEEAIEKYLKEGDGKTPLPVEYHTYEKKHRDFHLDSNKDLIIYESKEWVKEFGDIRDDNTPVTVWQTLRDVVFSPNRDWSQDEHVDGFNVIKVGNYRIVMRCKTDKESGRLLEIYLLSISENPNYESLKNKGYDKALFEVLSKRMRRCYPELFFADKTPKLWLEVENDTDSQANLVLSPEENTILSNAQYPMFINGLAGSGKSTLLYYLFACIYAYKRQHHPDHSLLFLSYSQRLVDKARSYISSILRLNQEFAGGDNNNLKADLEQFVQPFRLFVRNKFLTQQERDVKFHPENYIDYARFRVEYNDDNDCSLREKKKISAAIVWSVIRTFIKGYSSTSYLTPEQYRGLDQTGASKDVTVDNDVYALAYDIWNRWYKHKNERDGMWDDLDLVRYVLVNGRIDTRYAAVFCDEAQDFTRVETEFILGLSKHACHDLSAIDELKHIPIAFAGDPNQTISPTGFRFGSIQKLFNDEYEKLINGYIGMKEEPLNINYRSKEGIVNFSNSIQYLRHQLTDKSSGTYQEAWDNEGTKHRQSLAAQEGNVDVSKVASEPVTGFNYVAFYPIEENSQDLNQYMEKALSVITAEDDEYTVTADVESSQQDKDDANKTLTRIRNLGIPATVEQNNVYTAITAKGLEFNSSVLYRFASIPESELAIKAFRKRFVDGDQTINRTEKFALTHFFTKLYVAVSRAKEVLFVLDTKEAYDNFWKYLCEPELWKQYIQRDNRPFNTGDKNVALGLMSPGLIEDYITLLNKEFNANEEAMRLFSEAKGGWDIDAAKTMQRAKSYFAFDNNQIMMKKCDAYAALYTGKHDKAGELFLSIDEEEEAINAFWNGMCWTRVVDHTQGNDTKRFVALYMSGNKPVVDFLNGCGLHHDQMLALFNPDVNERNGVIHRQVIEKVIADVKNLTPEVISDKLIEAFEMFCSVDDVEAIDKEVAQLHYKRACYINKGRDYDHNGLDPANFNHAVDRWESARDTNHDSYFYAKLCVANDASEQIKYLNLLRCGDHILDKFGAESMASLLTLESQAVIFTLLLSKDYKRAISYPYPVDAQVKWNRLYSHDAVKFMKHVVLEDFTAEKYYFVEDKVKNVETTFFESKLSGQDAVVVMDKIFALTREDPVNNQPGWMLFVNKLKNANGNRVLKSEECRTLVLDALARVIGGNPSFDKKMASCFLEMLFGTGYNNARARKYKRVLMTIFSRDVFFKEDFRGATKRNRYFVNAEVDNDELDRIKSNMSAYARADVDATKKVTNKTIDDVKAMCRIVEIAVAYQDNKPAYDDIVKFYGKYTGDKRFAEIVNWMQRRREFNRYIGSYKRDEISYVQFAAELKDKCVNMHSLVDELSIEDATAFIIAVTTGRGDYNYEATFSSAKLIYKLNLTSYYFSPAVLNKLDAWVDLAVDDVLADKKHIDEFALKTLAFVWEALNGKHEIPAKRYDRLVSNRRIERLSVLVDYFKRRAMYHYSFVKDRIFNSKQEEYGLMMDKKHAQEQPRRPRIADKDRDADEVIPSVKTTREELLTAASPEEKAQKEGQLAVARNLKKMGIPVAVIAQAAPLLTIAEIEAIEVSNDTEDV